MITINCLIINFEIIYSLTNLYKSVEITIELWFMCVTLFRDDITSYNPSDTSRSNIWRIEALNRLRII